MADTPIYSDAPPGYAPVASSPTANNTTYSDAPAGYAPVATPPQDTYGLTDALVHGATLGLSGPVKAFATALGDAAAGRGFDYSNAINTENAARNAYASQHPYLNTFANLGGGAFFGAPLASSAGEIAAAGGSAVPGVAKGVTNVVAPATRTTSSIASNVARGAVTGAGLGGIAGAADNADSVPNALVGGAIGAGTGGLVGAAAPALVQGAQAIGRGVGGMVNPAWGARNQANRMIGGAFAKDMEGGGPSPTDVSAAMPPGSSTSTIPAYAGENVSALTGTLARSNTPARQIVSQNLNNLDTQAGPILLSGIDDSFGARLPSYNAEQTLRQVQQQQAGPRYQRAYAAPPLNPDHLMPGGALTALAQRPAFKAAMVKATNLAAEEGRDPNSLGIDVDRMGNPTFTQVPSWQTLDYVKRGLDDVVASYRDPLNGRLNTTGTTVNNTRSQLVSFLNQQNPALAQARAAYAGPQAAIDAMRAGQSFTNMDPAEISGTMADYTPSERAFFQLGAKQNLNRTIMTTPNSANEANRLVRTPQAVNQLRTTFGDTATDNFMNNYVNPVNAEFQSRQQILGNSATAGRLAANQESGGEGKILPGIGQAIAGFAAHEPVVGGIGLARAMGGIAQKFGGNTPAAQTTAARMLMTTDPAERQKILQAALGASQGVYRAPIAPIVSGLLGTGLRVPPTSYVPVAGLLSHFL